MGQDTPTPAQLSWLRRGLDQPGGKLPLFDGNGRKVPASLVRCCIAAGWCEPWFSNPTKPDWLVCKLTPAGRVAALPRNDGADKDGSDMAGAQAVLDFSAE